MAMSTARAEATLAVLEAERAQLERRLKRVSAGMYAARGVRTPSIFRGSLLEDLCTISQLFFLLESHLRY